MASPREASASKKGLWAKNDKEIRVALDKLKKVKHIDMPNTKIERNYLKDMTLADARLFRYRCQIIDNIKGINHQCGYMTWHADSAPAGKTKTKITSVDAASQRS